MARIVFTVVLMMASVLVLACSTSRPQPAKPAPAPTQAATPPEPTHEEVLAYGLGRVIVSDLRHYYFTPAEAEMLAKGAKDQLANQVLLKEEDRKNLALGLQAMAKERAQERIDLEKAASSKHLAELGSREGASYLDDTGIVILAMTPGDGGYPTEDQWLQLHSRAWLRDGTELVNSFKADEPTLAQTKYFLPCWNEVLPRVQVGGRVQFACPSEQVYGDQGRTGQVLPGAMVAFEIELMRIYDNPEAAEDEKFSEGAADSPPAAH